MRQYTTITTFQKNDNSHQLKPATSYFAGDNNGAVQQRSIEYQNYIAVVQTFDDMEAAYHNVAIMNKHQAVFDKALNKVLYNV